MWQRKGVQCPSDLHKHPLTGQMAAASAEAARRLVQGWQNVECANCRMFGWIPPKEGK